MDLRDQVRTTGQTLDGMAEAWWERLDDAYALADSGREAGRIYLLGYVAEMSLKVALFRLLAVPGGTHWSSSSATSLQSALAAECDVLGSAGRDPRLSIRWEGGHSLPLFATVLLRAARRRGMPLRSERTVLRAVNDVHRQWCVEMRYWPGRPPRPIADGVCDAVWSLLCVLN